MSKKLVLVGIAVILVLVVCTVVYHNILLKPSGASPVKVSESISSQSSGSLVKSESNSKVDSSTIDSTATVTGKPSDQAEGKEQIRTRTTIFNFNAMTHGNFSSVKGTWQNAGGQTITFDEKGLVSEAASITSFNYDAAGNLIVNVQDGQTGYSIWFVMKGNVIVPEGDTSDTNRDRLFAGQGIPDDIASAAYYRVEQ